MLSLQKALKQISHDQIQVFVYTYFKNTKSASDDYENLFAKILKRVENIVAILEMLIVSNTLLPLCFQNMSVLDLINVNVLHFGRD